MHQVSYRFLESFFHRVLRVIFLAALAAMLAGVARAEPRLEGPLDAVRLDARGATVHEVLAALGTAYGLRFRTGTSLNRTLTGTYAGPLRSVLAQVLNGYDYIVKNANNTIEVVVIGTPITHSAASPTAHPTISRPLAPTALPSPPGTRLPGL